MPPFKDPSFQDRSSQAAQAKQKALDNLRRKPPVDEAILAERRAARLAKEEAEAEKRRVKQAAAEEAKAAAAAATAAAQAEAAAAAAARPAPLTEAEKKAARDARYAARKNRK